MERADLVLTVLLKTTSPTASAMSSLVTDDSNKPLGSTFQQTSRGQLRPYNAAFFDVPDCAVPPRLADVGGMNKVPDVLKQYLFRVGDDGTCLYDPNFLGVCNPPLAPDTTYRYNSCFWNGGCCSEYSIGSKIYPVVDLWNSMMWITSLYQNFSIAGAIVRLA